MRGFVDLFERNGYDIYRIESNNSPRTYIDRSIQNSSVEYLDTDSEQIDVVFAKVSEGRIDTWLGRR